MGSPKGVAQPASGFKLNALTFLAGEAIDLGPLSWPAMSVSAFVCVVGVGRIRCCGDCARRENFGGGRRTLNPICRRLRLCLWLECKATTFPRSDPQIQHPTCQIANDILVLAVSL